MKTTLTAEQKAFNASPDGQRAMCRDADSRGTALYMNRVVKQKGGTKRLREIIEGVRSVRWNHEGCRLKDAQAWCEFYSALAALERASEERPGKSNYVANDY